MFSNNAIVYCGYGVLVVIAIIGILIPYWFPRMPDLFIRKTFDTPVKHHSPDSNNKKSHTARQ